MKKINGERGAISILVAITMLLFISFLVVMYLFVSSKAELQAEATEKVKEMYKEDANEIYNSFFANNEIIPIYTVDQLLKIGTDEYIQIDEVGGKYYYFSPTATYALMNDLKFKGYEFGEDYYWTPIGNRTDLQIDFVGNGNKIEVEYINEEGEIYSRFYTEEKNYTELIQCTFTINAIPENAKITINGVETNSVIVEEGTKVNWKVEDENHHPEEGTQVVTEDTDLDINLKPIKCTFTINATPANAKVTIGGVETKSVVVNKGTSVRWKVEDASHHPQEGTQIVNADTTLNIDLDIIRYTLTINPTPSDSNVIITSNGETILNGKGAQSIEINIGTNIEYSVERMHYYSKSGTATMNQDVTVGVSLESKPERTLEILPASVTAGSGYVELDNALSDVEDNQFAMSDFNPNTLTWHFDTSAISSDAKITYIKAIYKLGTSVSCKGVVNMNAGSTNCFSLTTGNLPISLSGQKFETEATTLPTGQDLAAGLTLSARKEKSGSALFRCFGARMIIKYIEP